MEKTSCDFTRSQSKAGSVTGAVLKNRALVLYECLYGRSDSAHAAHSSAAAAAAAASAAPGQPEITRVRCLCIFLSLFCLSVNAAHTHACTHAEYVFFNDSTEVLLYWSEMCMVSSCGCLI